ncbi:MAG: GntR family transcriptional regulator [Lachnospiraceae bacterium]|nr:GntR family transcriptional regulator [Lachnospiraceae bacterium]
MTKNLELFTKNPGQTTKKLKHVKIYDQLYELIQNGTYPAGSQLPSETTLSAQMNVSRMTLRKALALLQEDGLTKNIQGIGHFVCSQSEDPIKQPLSAPILHPVYSYCTETLDSVEMAFRIEPPTQSITDSLKQYTPVVVITDRWYKHQGNPLAYSLSFLPIGVIGTNQIDLNHTDQLLQYLESQCYQNMNCCRRICSHSTAGNFTASTYTLSNENSFLLIQETIFDKDQTILVSNKHYIPSDLFKIEFTL